MVRIKNTDRDVTSNPDEWPDWYYVTRCDVCDARIQNEWDELNWEWSPYERQHRFVKALAGWDMETTLTEVNERTVLALVKQHHLTKYDFKLLDEKPGRYGYDVMIDGKKCQWHWKLRQVRNRHNDLFDILEQNEANGYSNDDTTPKMSPLFVNERMG